MKKYYSRIPWCRYADDGLAHCKSEKEAIDLMDTLRDLNFR